MLLTSTTVHQAPEDIRNCFQQRSRWCKGHFQIFFSSKCPLLQPRLSLGMRLLYGSTILSYMACVINTPVFAIIPVLTVWCVAGLACHCFICNHDVCILLGVLVALAASAHFFANVHAAFAAYTPPHRFGWFPILINQWAAIAITFYFGATMILVYYCRSLSDIKHLWFSQVSNAILWWAYAKAAWRTTIGAHTTVHAHTSRHTTVHAHTPPGRYLKGGIAFKSTLKGINAISSFFAWLAHTSFRDVWIHILTFVLLAVTIVTAIVTAASNGGNVYTPQVLF